MVVEEEEELQACVMPEYDPFDFDPAYIKVRPTW